MQSDENVRDLVPGKNPDAAYMFWFRMLIMRVNKHLNNVPVTVTLGETRPTTVVMPGVDPVE